MSTANWLHTIKRFPCNLYHRYHHWTLPISRFRSSVSILQLCVFVYWTLRRRALSNKIVAKSSVTVFFKASRLPIKLHRMKLQVAFHISYVVCFSGSAAQCGLWPPCPRGFLITHNDAPVNRTPLHEWSARRRDLYLTTHNTQQKNIHVPGGIRTNDRSRRAAVDLRLRPRGHWDRPIFIVFEVFFNKKGQIKPPPPKLLFVRR
jgi:hypothetical protein